MTQRASILVTTTSKPRRAPPKHRHVPDRPPDGYHVTERAPVVTHYADMDHVEEIVRSLARITELDEQMLRLEHDMTTHEAVLADPSADGWDRLDAENALEPLTEDYTRARWQVIQLAGEISTHGHYMIGDWKDDELAAIGRHLSHLTGALPRVLEECRGIETHETFQVLCGEAVTF
jgi:hypothetical protein